MSQDQVNQTDQRLFICTVGKKPSLATTYVNDAKDVGDLLEQMAGATTVDET